MSDDIRPESDGPDSDHEPVQVDPSPPHPVVAATVGETPPPPGAAKADRARPVLPRMALAFLAGVVCLAVAVGVQHLRHGWPFSLHHGLGSATESAHVGHGDGASVVHPRAPVDVDEARASSLGIRDEDGVLVGYVYADIDLSERDLGGWVDEAKALVEERIDLPPGYRLAWTGQYEHMEIMLDRMSWVVPISLLLVLALLRFAMRGWVQTWLVMTSLPFGLVGSVWFLHAERFNVSTAVWVGLIAVFGIAQETGILMVELLDESVLRRAREKGAALVAQDVDEAIVEGASRRLRPLAMSVGSTALGLLPLLWETGPGADMAVRIALPVIGGVLSCLVLTLLVLPAAYAIWRRWQLKRGLLAVDAETPEASS